VKVRHTEGKRDRGAGKEESMGEGSFVDLKGKLKEDRPEKAEKGRSAPEAARKKKKKTYPFNEAVRREKSGFPGGQWEGRADPAQDRGGVASSGDGTEGSKVGKIVENARKRQNPGREKRLERSHHRGKRLSQARWRERGKGPNV